MGRNFVKTMATLTAMALVAGCSKSSDSASVAATPKTLYAATGACNAGAGAALKTTYTTTNATKTIEKFNSSNGANTGFLVDFTVSNFLVDMNPQTMIDNGSSLFVLMENPTTTTERSILKMPKADPLAYVKYYTNATSLSAAMKSLALDIDGSFIVGAQTKLEKINSQPVRVPAGANAWVNAPASTCATSATAMSAVAIMDPLAPAVNGKIIYAHQGFTGAFGAAQQRLGIIGAGGYTGTTDCVIGVQISAITHTRAASAISSTAIAFNSNGTSPTAMVYIPSAGNVGKLIVAYSNDQVGNYVAVTGVYNVNHAIVQWDVADTGALIATLNNPVILYDNTSVTYGISAMAYDASTKSLYVATGGEPGAVNMATNNVGYNIEKFTLDTATPLLTRVSTNNQPFIKGAANLKCISSLMLGN